MGEKSFNLNDNLKGHIPHRFLMVLSRYFARGASSSWVVRCACQDASLMGMRSLFCMMNFPRSFMETNLNFSVYLRDTLDVKGQRKENRELWPANTTYKRDDLLICPTGEGKQKNTFSGACFGKARYFNDDDLACIMDGKNSEIALLAILIAWDGSEKAIAHMTAGTNTKLESKIHGDGNGYKYGDERCNFATNAAVWILYKLLQECVYKPNGFCLDAVMLELEGGLDDSQKEQYPSVMGAIKSQFDSFCVIEERQLGEAA